MRISRRLRMCGAAPEVLNGEGYDNKVDLWSLGVVVYIMYVLHYATHTHRMIRSSRAVARLLLDRLCGFPPFMEDESSFESVYEKIRSGVLDFPHPYWTNVSEEAKDLIRRLLTVPPHERFSAAQALEHPWIKGVSMAYNEQPLSSAILEMKRFNQKRRFN